MAAGEIEKSEKITGRSTSVRSTSWWPRASLATIAPDVSPEPALATISAVEVLGAFRASPAVKAALVPRTV